jgi:hypothetical protein
MFRRFWSALDRLITSINSVAERFEAADRELADRINNGRPMPVEDDAATKELPAVVVSTASTASTPTDPEKSETVNGTTSKSKKPRQTT